MLNTEYIRELAYYLWISEGKPDGKSQCHWDMATKMANESDKTGKSSYKRSIDPSEVNGTEPEQPDQT